MTPFWTGSLSVSYHILSAGIIWLVYIPTRGWSGSIASLEPDSRSAEFSIYAVLPVGEAFWAFSLSSNKLLHCKRPLGGGCGHKKALFIPS